MYANDYSLEYNTGKTLFSISGTITIDGIEKGQNVDIYLDATPHGTTTDEQGAFRIENIPAGKYTLNAFQMGYDKYRQDITIDRNLNHIKINLAKKDDDISERRMFAERSYSDANYHRATEDGVINYDDSIPLQEIIPLQPALLPLQKTSIPLQRGDSILQKRGTDDSIPLQKRGTDSIPLQKRGTDDSIPLQKRGGTEDKRWTTYFILFAIIGVVCYGGYKYFKKS